MTSKGVQLRVQYTAGQLSRDTHHIKVKAIPHKSEHITKNRKTQKQNRLNKQNKMDIDVFLILRKLRDGGQDPTNEISFLFGIAR